MQFLIQDTWIEFDGADDIINYCLINGSKYEILNENDLLLKTNFFEYIFFCDTNIVYQQLQKNNLTHLCPCTYDKKFNCLFGRNIKEVKLHDVDFDIPIFIKPVMNTKIFSGHIIYDKLQLDSLKIEFGNTCIYTSNVINIIGEYRLLIGNSKLYGSSYMKGSYDENYLEKMDINKIIDLVGNSFLCVDIGLLNNGNYIVVEINPPYSLDDYDIEFEQYINFCIDSCNYINSHAK